MTIFNVISMLGGLALFLYGMRLMGDGLKQGSSTALKNAMKMVTNNPLMGFALGLCVTGVIQSSSATVVLTAGLVGAGIISVHQCIGIVIGAHLGTTVTGQIIRLLDLDAGGMAWIKFFQPSTLAPLAAILGIIMLMTGDNKVKPKLIGTIAMGFGVLFTGLMSMTSSVSPLSESEVFANLFMGFAGRPFLGFITGMLTALLFHSSASVGILQALSVTGSLTFGSVYAIMLGIYMGDCIITGLMVSIGASANAKRVGCVHIVYCIAKDIVILAGIMLLKQIGILGAGWSDPITSGGIANANTLFNLGAAVVILPFSFIIERISCSVVRGGEEETVSKAEQVAVALNKNLYGSPELALEAALNVIGYISRTAANNVERAFRVIERFDDKIVDEIDVVEDDLDMLTDRVGDYLANLSSLVRIGNETNRLNYFIKCVSEFERIGDLADNIRESAIEMHQKGISFTESARQEINILHSAITEVLDHTHNAFVRQSDNEAHYVEPIEEAIDDIIIIMKSNHYERVRDGSCTVLSGYIFLDILTNLERISDQCANIAVHTISVCDPSIADAEHDYIKNLHMGADEDFNAKYKMYTERYTANIRVLGKNGNAAS